MIGQPIFLFMDNELARDEQIIQEANDKAILDSIIVEKVEYNPIDDLSSSLWLIGSEHLVKRPIIYVKYCHIQSCRVKINYKCDSLSILNLYKGDLRNYIMNMTDIKELHIQFKQFMVDQKLLLQDTVSQIVKFYLKDLLRNQKLNLLASVYPIRITINVIKAFTTLA